MKYIITVVVAFFVAVVSAAAQQPTEDTSANSVFLGCKAYAENRMTNMRLGAIGHFCAGVVHGLAYVAVRLPQEDRSCAPPTSDAQQLARVVISYIEARPQRMVIERRLEPCKNGSPITGSAYFRQRLEPCLYGLSPIG